MDQPGMLGSGVSNDGDMMRMIAELQRQYRELAAANPFAPMGVTPTADGFTVTGTETIDGGLIVNGPETVNGPITINGPAEITGTLSLPAGIIDNAALTDPLVINTSGLTQNNFSIATTGSVVASATVSVPAGYSRADVLCMVVAGAFNSTGAGDYLYVASSIGGTSGGETPQPALASAFGSASANGIRSLTGLSGGTITVGCSVRTQTAGWAANGSNFANVNAVFFFRR